MRWTVETIGTFENDEELIDFVTDRFHISPVDITNIVEAVEHLKAHGLDVKALGE